MTKQKKIASALDCSDCREIISEARAKVADGKKLSKAEEAEVLLADLLMQAAREVRKSLRTASK